jgi:hypothetical protein
MSVFIAREFSFSRDFRKIKWSATLGYNLLRSFFAGLIFGILMYFFPQGTNDQSVALTVPFIWPCAYLIFFVPFGLLLSFLSPFLRLTGLFSFFLALISVTLGDPILCVIKALFPQVVPVDEPPLFSTNLLIFVIDVPEISIPSYGHEQHFNTYTDSSEGRSSGSRKNGNAVGGIIIIGIILAAIIGYFNSNKSTIQKTNQAPARVGRNSRYSGVFRRMIGTASGGIRGYAIPPYGPGAIKKGGRMAKEKPAGGRGRPVPQGPRKPRQKPAGFGSFNESKLGP